VDGLHFIFEKFSETHFLLDISIKGYKSHVFFNECRKRYNELMLGQHLFNFFLHKYLTLIVTIYFMLRRNVTKKD